MDNVEWTKFQQVLIDSLWFEPKKHVVVWTFEDGLLGRVSCDMSLRTAIAYMLGYMHVVTFEIGSREVCPLNQPQIIDALLTSLRTWQSLL